MANATPVQIEQPAKRPCLTRGALNAQRILRLGFTVAPILAGLDKFFHVLVDWGVYLNPAIGGIFPGGTEAFMRMAGVIEIGGGLLVWFAPAIGGAVVGIWLLGIAVNLLTIPAYFDIALRDFGLALGAFSLALLSKRE